MELRRALLLFAIVLGLAAIASSIARPPDRQSSDATSTAPATAPGEVPAAAPRPGTPAAEQRTLRFPAGIEPRTRRLEQGEPATLLVEVDAPAQIDIPTLGLTQPAEPLTPARFDVLISRPGAHRLVLQPLEGGAAPSTAGTLKVVPAS